MPAKFKTFSLLSVSWTNPDGTVSGYWIQDHTGTLRSASKKAREYENFGSNKNPIAVIEMINHPVPILEFWENRKPLHV